jgi:hypothetical protein
MKSADQKEPFRCLEPVPKARRKEDLVATFVATFVELAVFRAKMATKVATKVPYWSFRDRLYLWMAQ